MEPVLTFMFYIAATPFQFPLGRINMSLPTTWNLYTSDLKTGAPLHVSLLSTCFHSGLPWAVTAASGNSTKLVTLVNRIRGILPCSRDDSIGGVIAKAFFKVKYFWKAVGLLVNMYWCVHCYWSAVISKIFCAWIVKRGIWWEHRIWRRVLHSCAAWYKTGHSRCPWVWGTAHSRTVVELVPFPALLQLEEANLKISSNKVLVCSKPGASMTGFCSQTERQSPVTLVFVLTVSQSPSNY